MIKTEIIDNKLIRHYSDAGHTIRQVETGVVYSEAVDVMPCRYTYEETDELMTVDEISDAEAIAIIMGGAADD